MSPPDRVPTTPDAAVAVVPVCRVPAAGPVVHEPDVLAVEEPLEIRIGHRAVSVTMRTPGHDVDLAAGFLFSEGILTFPGQVAGVHRCARSPNVLRVTLAADCQVDLARLERHSYTTSSCGVCGKTALASIRVPVDRRGAPGQPVLDGDVIRQLPARLRDSQAVFDRTGALHAAGLFEPDGKLLTVREDIGRHNALDKLIGHEFLAGRLPLDDSVVLVSGRLCFELVQKAAVAGVPVLAAVGAPSSLAVEVARECGMTLIGFVRDDRFNVYTGAGRVAVS